METSEILRLIGSVRFGYATENELQQQLHELLKTTSAEVIREHRLSSRDRVDFFLKSERRNVALECKIKGSVTAITSQLARYAESEDVSEIVLVTSKRVHLAAECFREKEILGKPLYGVWIGGM